MCIDNGMTLILDLFLFTLLKTAYLILYLLSLRGFKWEFSAI